MIFRFTCFMFLLVTRGRPLYLFESLVFFYSERTLRINSFRQITEYMIGSILARRFRIFLFLQGLLRNFKFSSVCVWSVNFWGSWIFFSVHSPQLSLLFSSVNNIFSTLTCSKPIIYCQNARSQELFRESFKVRCDQIAPPLIDIPDTSIRSNCKFAQ
jgi:hypothetical protein